MKKVTIKKYCLIKHITALCAVQKNKVIFSYKFHIVTLNHHYLEADGTFTRGIMTEYSPLVAGAEFTAGNVPQVPTIAHWAQLLTHPSSKQQFITFFILCFC